MTEYVGLIPFIIYAAVFTIVLYSDIRPALKRKLFRIAMVLFGVSMLIVIPMTGTDPLLLVFVIPVLLIVLYIAIRYMKICEECGWPAQTNFPFVDKETCRKCGGRLM
jgi:hypothetical protein